MKTFSTLVACGCTLMIISGAGAVGPAVPTVIYSDIASSPTSQVPGLGGALFSSFDRIYRSANGLYWIMTADTDLATTQDEVLIVGTIASASGSVVVQEGVTATTAGTVGLLDRNVGINNSGQYVFATNTDGASTSDEVIVMWDGAQFVVAAQEGTALPSPFGTESHGSTLDGASIWNDGKVSYRAPFTSGTLISDEDDFLIAGGQILAQEGVTVPGNQAGGASEVWDNFDSQDFYHNGTDWLAQGDLSGSTSTDDVVVFNGDVVLQEGNPIPGGPADNIGLSGISESFMDNSGNWFARGDFDVTDQDWLVMNGNVLALTGDAVPGGLVGETYSDAAFSGTFFLMTGNSNGDFVFGATTSNADPLADAVLVYNNQTVIARQGDAVDLDGNGLLDDDAYIDIFNNDDAFLTDDGEYWFTADLMDGTGADIGQALLHFQVVPTPGALALLGLAGCALRRRRRN